MNKSIYDEALEILLNSLQDPQDEGNVCYSLSLLQMNKITKTILQAQKQEELLKLYKELSIKERKRAISEKTRNVDEYNQSSKEIETLEKIIKEVQNDKL